MWKISNNKISGIYTNILKRKIFLKYIIKKKLTPNVNVSLIKRKTKIHGSKSSFIFYLFLWFSSLYGFHISWNYKFSWSNSTQELFNKEEFLFFLMSWLYQNKDFSFLSFFFFSLLSLNFIFNFFCLIYSIQKKIQTKVLPMMMRLIP